MAYLKDFNTASASGHSEDKSNVQLGELVELSANKKVVAICIVAILTWYIFSNYILIKTYHDEYIRQKRLTRFLFERLGEISTGSPFEVISNENGRISIRENTTHVLVAYCLDFEAGDQLDGCRIYFEEG